MTPDLPAYGLWPLVVMNVLVFALFALGFTRPRTRRDWRSFGVFTAFLVALFAEMYGFPLTLYLLSSWFGPQFGLPGAFTHDGGHLLNALIGWRGDPHVSPPHLLSSLLIGGGFWLVAWAWAVLYRAQQQRGLARSGPYAWMRHPQYAGFVLILTGFLVQWPTLLTLLMYPVLVVMYRRLARLEEAEARRSLGRAYAEYADHTPAFLPRWGGHARRTPGHPV